MSLILDTLVLRLLSLGSNKWCDMLQDRCEIRAIAYILNRLCAYGMGKKGTSHNHRVSYCPFPFK